VSAFIAVAEAQDCWYEDWELAGSVAAEIQTHSRGNSKCKNHREKFPTDCSTSLSCNYNFFINFLSE